MKEKRARLIKSVMLGHAVADALGVPVEFCSRESLRADPVVNMRGYGTHGMPPGTFSDDTSMSIAALDAIKRGELDYIGTMRNFAAWYHRGEYTATGEFFDIGGSCRYAIDSFTSSDGDDPFGHADDGEFSCGNGGLMRIHPFALLAYYKTRDISERLRIVHDATSLTHAHPRCLLASGIFSIMLWELIDEPSLYAITRGALCARNTYFGSKTISSSIKGELRHFARTLGSLSTIDGVKGIAEEQIRSTGYVVDTLEAALFCIMTTNDYTSAVLRAVNLGSDTDTVAAITGALAGALYGIDAIPREWLDGLIGRERISEMCEVLAGNL